MKKPLTLPRGPDGRFLRRKAAFPFLELPGEIRNQIYSYLVRDAKPEDIRKRVVSYQFSTAILLVNRQIAAEAVDILYQDQELTLRPNFWVPEVNGSQSFLAVHPHFRKIRLEISACKFDELTVIYYEPGRYVGTLFSIAFYKCLHGLTTELGKLPNLEVLEIGFDCFSSSEKRGGYKMCPETVLECFKSLRGLKSVSISGNLTEEYARDIIAAMKLPKI